MRRIELFRLVGKIFIDSAQAQQDIKDTTETAETSESKMTKAFKNIGKAVAALATSTALVSFGKDCIETAATIQASNAQFTATFGDMQDKATSVFESVSEKTGILATRLRTEGTSAFSMFKGAGMDANTALEETETFMNLAADAAAYYDISLEEASERVRGFAKGNFENGDAIGVFTNETQRNSLAMEKYKKKFSECTEAQKQMLALDLIEQTYELNGAIGQAQRESDGYENVLGNLNEAWRQFKGVIGTPLLQKLIPILQNLTQLTLDFTQKIQNSGEYLQLFKNYIQQAQEWCEKHKTGLQILAVAVGTLTTALIAYNASSIVAAASSAAETVAIYAMIVAENACAIATGLASGAMSAFGAVMAFVTSPVTLVILAIGALVAGFIYLWNNCEGFRNFWLNLWEKLKTATQQAIKIIKDLLNGKLSFIKDIFNNIKTIFTNFIDFFKNIFTGNWEGAWENLKNIFYAWWDNILIYLKVKLKIFQQIWGTIKEYIIKPIADALNKVLQSVKNTWDNIKNWSAEIKNTIVNSITNLFESIKSYIVNFFNTIKPYIKQALLVIVAIVFTVFKTLYNTFIQPFVELGTLLYAVIEQYIIEPIKISFDRVVEIFNLIKDIISEILTNAINIVSEKWFSIKEKISSVLTTILTTVNEKWNSIKTKITSILNAIVAAVTNKWNSIKTKITSILTTILTVVSEKWNSIKTKINSILNTIVTTVTNKWNSIKAKISSILQSILSTVTSKWNSIKTKISSTASSILDTVKTKFNNIKTSITTPIKNAYNTVKEWLGKLKTAFTSFSAKIKTPHFSISNASLNPKDWITNGVPSINVSWYKKGGILTEPTIFGMSGGNLLGGGEAGDEAVLPINNLRTYVNEEMQNVIGGTEEKLQRMLNVFEEYFPQFAQQPIVAVGDAECNRITERGGKGTDKYLYNKTRR